MLLALPADIYVNAVSIKGHKDLGPSLSSIGTEIKPTGAEI